MPSDQRSLWITTTTCLERGLCIYSIQPPDLEVEIAFRFVDSKPRVQVLEQGGRNVGTFVHVPHSHQRYYDHVFNLSAHLPGATQVHRPARFALSGLVGRASFWLSNNLKQVVRTRGTLGGSISAHSEGLLM